MRPASLLRRAAAIVALTLLTGACADEAALHGLVRDQPLEVGGFALPDVTDPSLRAGGIVDDGRLLMRAASPDRLLLVYFGFLNCPDVCPTTLADLRSALTLLDEAQRGRVDLAFITVDPDRDGPEELAAYLRHFAPQHHAVRAPAAELAPVMDAFLASSTVEVQEDGTVDVAHTAVLYAVDTDGRVVIEWPFGTSATMLAEDLAILLADAAAGA